ncbi:hypothetical protein CEXT_445041 [Caerostris extrusa]|uniref:Uncharacterized protein n=1 Tax=Caerostris extrusa TaxID=172846 RepID=A0AAV4Y3S9_CAEEX|nr:hypothetical protein CEXT_445041 [Caerostris extrusa]
MQLKPFIDIHLLLLYFVSLNESKHPSGIDPKFSLANMMRSIVYRQRYHFMPNCDVKATLTLISALTPCKTVLRNKILELGKILSMKPLKARGSYWTPESYFHGK